MSKNDYTRYSNKREKEFIKEEPTLDADAKPEPKIVRCLMFEKNPVSSQKFSVKFLGLPRLWFTKRNPLANSTRSALHQALKVIV